MSKYKLSARSLSKLAGIDADLVKVVKRAIEITEVDFMVTEGLRTVERQRALLAAGASKTLKSMHLIGRAVDLAAYVDGEVRWDWPLYDTLAKAMKAASEEVGVNIVWGGDWKTFKDGPHFQLA